MHTYKATYSSKSAMYILSLHFPPIPIKNFDRVNRVLWQSFLCQSFPSKTKLHVSMKLRFIKARCHYQSFPSKNLSKKTWTKCLLSLSKFVDHLCQRIGGKSCKHGKMAPTLTNYENIAVTLCLMSIAILRRRLQDRARVRRRATRSWLLITKKRIQYTS
jgi:hypothetical protein